MVDLQQPSTSTISDSLSPTDMLPYEMNPPSKLQVPDEKRSTPIKPDNKRKSVRKLPTSSVNMQNQESSSSEVSDCNGGYFVATKFDDPNGQSYIRNEKNSADEPLLLSSSINHNNQSDDIINKASSEESLTRCPRNLPRHDMIWRYGPHHNNRSHPAYGSEKDNISERITRLKESLNEVAEYLPSKYGNPELENIFPLNSSFIHPSPHRESSFSFTRTSSNQATTNVVRARKDDVETNNVLSDQSSHGHPSNLRPIQSHSLPHLVIHNNIQHSNNIRSNNCKKKLHVIVSTTPANQVNKQYSLRSTGVDSIQEQRWHPPTQSFSSSHQQKWSTSTSADPPEFNQQQKWSTSMSTDPPGHSISTPSWDLNEIVDELKRDPSVEPLRDPPSVNELITDCSIRNSITPKSRGTSTTYTSNSISTTTRPTILLPSSDEFVKVKPEANNKSYLTSEYTQVQTTPSWESYEVDHTHLQTTKSWGDSSMDLLFKEIDDIENEFCSIVASLPSSSGSDSQSLLSGLKSSSINSYLKERMKKTNNNNEEQHSLVEITLNKCTSFGSHSSTGSSMVTDVVERMRKIKDCIKQIDSVDDDELDTNTNDDEYCNSREGEMSELIERLANAAESLRELNEWDD
jgi:hypothetical protein